MGVMLFLFLLPGFLESLVPGVERIGDIPSFLQKKKKLLSVFVDMGSLSNDGIVPVIVGQCLSQNVPVYYLSANASESETLSRFRESFAEYRFALILPSRSASIAPSLVHAIWYHSVPIYNGFFTLSYMFSNGVVGWSDELGNFNLTDLIHRVSSLNKKIRFLWSYQQIMQEAIWYRYGSSADMRQSYIERVLTEGSRKKFLPFVGIYSAVENRKFRDAIRSTWGAVLRQIGIGFRFFLSQSRNSSITLAEDSNDIVVLPVKEGYQYNSRKGVEFLKWVAENWSTKAKFLIKTDDDIYWNPLPLINQLKSVQPVGYVWGFIDYISPVPKNASSPFYNSQSIYPFPTFPTYPRGLVRVTSMDIVEAIARNARERKLRMIFGDDPAFGIHLRQIRADHNVPYIRIDDFASYSRFAMEPSCHPNAWRRVTNETWIIHHVIPSHIYCLHESKIFPNCSCF
jgi:hypothetical protein